MTNDDFLTAMEHFQEFINTPLIECLDSDKDYPVGIGYKGVKIYFQHYHSWDEAIIKWNERLPRIDHTNIAIILSNYNGIGAESHNTQHTGGVIERFRNLPFKHKIAFTDNPTQQCDCVVYLKRYNPQKGDNVFNTDRRTLKRYIDQFDYISFLNGLNK